MKRQKAGLKTLNNFIRTALQPVGQTLYVYGGGWNEKDSGSGIQAVTLGVSPNWINFFQSQNELYDYHKYYPHDGRNCFGSCGLDCSGFLGWTLYNAMHCQSGKEGYVGSATDFAKRLELYGWGKATGKIRITREKRCRVDIRPGDIVSIEGHVWISLGTCEDESVVIVHSSPTESRMGFPGGGVQISAIGRNKDCEAYDLADRYMSTYYPEWYARYETALKSPGIYFDIREKTGGHFRWDFMLANGLSDPDGLAVLLPEKLMEKLYEQWE